MLAHNWEETRSRDVDAPATVHKNIGNLWPGCRWRDQLLDGEDLVWEDEVGAAECGLPARRTVILEANRKGTCEKLRSAQFRFRRGRPTAPRSADTRRRREVRRIR